MGSLHLGILFIIGIGIFAGTIGAVLFQRFRIPQVIGYIVIGILVGRTGFKIIDAETIEAFTTFNFFALGIIGFLVGGELKGTTLKKYGKQFSGILLGEGLTAFLLVTALTGGVVFILSRDIVQSAAIGIIFGAIASATDPASTIDVLWEYRSVGILTTTLIAIVALDDALAMTLYGLASGFAQIISGQDISIGKQLLEIGIEIFGAVFAGAAAGFIMNIILRFAKKKERILVFGIGLLLLLISVAELLHMDVIFAALAFGLVIRNLAPRRSEELFDLIKGFSTPIYVLFFVFVGARVHLANMPWWMWLIVGLYVIGRNGGKILGALIGGRITNAHENVRKFTGLGLSAQGGVAIGLAIMASQNLGDTQILGMGITDIIIFTVTSTTFIFQITGPPLVKLASKLSGEIGKNITEEDIIEKWKVKDVIDEKPLLFNEGDTVKSVVAAFSANDYTVYPVVDGKNKFVGTISFEQIKEILTNQDVWEWIVAGDIVQESKNIFATEMKLEEALRTMKQLHADQVPVVDENNTPIGIIDSRKVKLAIEREIIAIKRE